MKLLGNLCKLSKKIRVIKLQSSGLVNGIFLPKYGAASSEKLGAMPLISIPLKWSCYPRSTKSFALTILDNDTVPIIGFPWIHWTVSNIPSSTTSLQENASTLEKSTLCQGLNSYAKGYTIDLKELNGFMVPKANATHYGGFVPVNFPHLYTVTIYALDIELNSKNGFTYNELQKAMESHIVGIGILTGIYNAKITYI